MVKKIELKFCGSLFLIFSFYTFYEISDSYLLIFVLLLCASTDIGGYTFGKLFKGPKLIRISPNKTYSGMIGGYLLSLISIGIISHFTNYSYMSIQIFIIILIISTVSQVGDIIVSYFKRLSKIKDTGKIIPGHGGLLDRIDGFIFVLPFAFISERLFF